MAVNSLEILRLVRLQQQYQGHPQQDHDEIPDLHHGSGDRMGLERMERMERRVDVHKSPHEAGPREEVHFNIGRSGLPR